MEERLSVHQDSGINFQNILLLMINSSIWVDEKFVNILFFFNFSWKLNVRL